MMNTSGYSKGTQIEVTIDAIRHGVPRNIWIVVLKEKAADRFLPIQVSEAQADILTGELQERPDKSVEPDQFLAKSGAAGSDIEGVSIHLENDTFYAKLLLEPYEVGCPIGVALALAARTKTPILVDETTWEKTALTVNWDWSWGRADSVIKAARCSENLGVF